MLVSYGCAARYVRIQEKGLTCPDAYRVAIETVRRMGYTITDATKASPGAPGIIVAAREEGTGKLGLMVSVFCTTAGAEVEARSDQGGMAQLSFPGEFRRRFDAVLANQAPPRPPAAAGVDVLLATDRAGDLGQLAVDLNGNGILPVSVRITNHTQRAYRFRVRGVELRTADGTRVRPLAAADLAKKLDAGAVETLRQKILEDHDIDSNDALMGWLFFPFNVYTSARVELIDRASGEAEGFSMEL